MQKKTRSAKEAVLKLRPLGDRVLLKLLSDEESETTTASGIIIPETADKERSEKRGRVLATGPGRRGDDDDLIPVDVKAGDEVIFQWGDKVEIEGEEYYIVTESNIIAVIEN